MIETSHHVALPIQRFWPLRIQVSPSRLAVEVIPPLVPEPTRGSVKPKQPVIAHRAVEGGHICFFFCEPARLLEAKFCLMCTPEKGEDGSTSRSCATSLKRLSF